MAVFTGNGSATSPSLTFSSNTNTGIYRSAANSVAITTNGVRRLNVDAAGAVIIDTGDATINGVRVGRGNGNSSSNTALGNGALTANTTGSFNTAAGSAALTANTTGSFNTAIGRAALIANTTGGCNTAYGLGTLGCNINGNFNNAYGLGALGSNIDGSSNSAFGSCALALNASGSLNSAVGNESLRCNTTGIQNSAFGNSTLCANTTGIQNSAFGSAAAASTTTASCNSAFGFDALRSNSTGCCNSALGHSAGFTNTTGCCNTFVGQNVSGSSATVSNETNIGHPGNTARFQGAATAWSFTSDGRDKTDIQDLPVGLEFILALKPRQFKWDRRNTDLDRGKDAAGFIAQEVLETAEQFDAKYTGVVNTDSPNQYMVALSSFVPILVKAVKELDDRIKALEG